MNGAHLAVTSGLPGRVFALREGSFVAGRAADADFELSHVEISRQHCRFTWDGTACVVEDLGSVRGTRVNGHRIEAPATLNPGDQVGIGPAIVVFGLGEAPAAVPREKAGPLATAQMLYVDRILLGAFTGAAVASVAMTTTTHLSRFSALTGVLVGAAALNLWLGRARVVDSHPKLLEAARRVAALFRVPVVVMGHSHRVVNQPVSDEARYYNLGTWVAPSRDGNEGPAGFPHVVVGSSGAALRRWTIDTDKSVGVVA